MEVPGEKSHGKSKYIPCQPCSADGENVEADGFCQNCHEYLCGTCIKYHRKATLSRHHAILDKDGVPKSIDPRRAKQLCTEVCDQHVLEVIKFFCRDHQVIGCGTCVILDHKSCSVDFIPDIADDFLGGTEFEGISIKVEQLRRDIESAKEAVIQKGRSAADAFLKATHAVRKFRKEIKKHLDEMEESLIAECDRMRKENERAVKGREAALESFKTELDVISDSLDVHSKQAGDLFVKAMQTKTHLRELEENMKSEGSIVVQFIEFKPNKEIEDTVSRKSPFGKIDVQTVASHLFTQKKGTAIRDFEPVFIENINARAPHDTHTPYISSMCAWTDNKMLCTDRENKAVKVIDTQRSCIITRISLNFGPWDITRVSEDQIAVTDPDNEEINFLTFNGKELSVCRKMKVSGRCRGIAFTNETLVVTYVPILRGESNIEILSLFGEVLRTFNVGDKFIISWAGCVDVGIHGDCIFVSDLQRNCVLKMTLGGVLLATYSDDTLRKPRALSVCKDGSVLVCSNGGSSVHLMSPDCEKVKIVLSGDEAKWVQSVCYNEVTATLCLYSYNIDDSYTSRLQPGPGYIRLYRNCAM